MRKAFAMLLSAAALLLATLVFRSSEGDSIQVEAHNVPGSSARVVVIHTREGSAAALLAAGGIAELAVGGREYRVDARLLVRQHTSGRWVQLAGAGGGGTNEIDVTSLVTFRDDVPMSEANNDIDIDLMLGDTRR